MAEPKVVVLPEVEVESLPFTFTWDFVCRDCGQVVDFTAYVCCVRDVCPECGSSNIDAERTGLV